MRVYSPSSTKTYAECPFKRELSRRGVQSKYAGKAAVARWIGTAVAKGFEQVNLERMGASPERVVSLAEGHAQASYQYSVSEFTNAGGVIAEGDADGVPQLIERAVRYYRDEYVYPFQHTIVAVEQPFEHGGHARPDLVIDDGSLAPLDFKCKRSLYVKPGETRDAARARVFAEYEDDWQLLHYVWCVRRFRGVPCNHYYIALCELTPKPHITIQRYDVTDTRMLQWADSAYGWWAAMEDTDNDMVNVPPQAPTHETKYGKCEYYDYCVTYEMDETRAQHRYITVERRRHE